MSSSPKKKPKLVKIEVEAKTPEEKRLFGLIREYGLEDEVSEILRAQMRLSRKIESIIEGREEKKESR